MNIFLDACILIYWVELKEPYYGNLINEFRRLDKEYPNNALFFSRLSYLECLTKPLESRDKNVIRQYEELFRNENFRIVELTETVIKLATHLSVKYKLKTPDAIQLGSALSLEEPSIFITNDYSRIKINEIKIKTINVSEWKTDV